MTSQKNTQPDTVKGLRTHNANFNDPIKGVGITRGEQSAQNQLWTSVFGSGGGKKRYKSVKRYRDR